MVYFTCFQALALDTPSNQLQPPPMTVMVKTLDTAKTLDMAPLHNPCTTLSLNPHPTTHNLIMGRSMSQNQRV